MKIKKYEEKRGALPNENFIDF